MSEDKEVEATASEGEHKTIEAAIGDMLQKLQDAYKTATPDDITYSISRVNDMILDFTMEARRERFRRQSSPTSCCQGKCKKQD